VSRVPEPAGRVEGFFHATVTVADMEASLRFYRDLLGLEVTHAWEHDRDTLRSLTGYEDPDGHAAILGCPDGTEIELVELRRPRGLERVAKRWHDAGLSFAAFRVSDIGALMERLRAAGVPFNSDVVHHRLEDGSIVKVVYCFAPEGTTITLVELPPGRRTLGASGGR
jgi:lactoylglutathione lyase